MCAVSALPAHAISGEGDGKTGRTGEAGAVVLRTGLDVSLLNKKVQAPLAVTLDEVHAPHVGSVPERASKTALSVTLDGVDKGQPVRVLRADVATARATAVGQRAEGYANLAHAKVHVPGLPLLSLIEVDAVSSKAVCEVGKRPTATSELPASVRVLGKKVTLSSTGTTKVVVPEVGEVRLDLARKSTTSDSAAATALGLTVSVNPLRMNVAKTEGRVTLAEANCKTPSGGSEGGSEGSGGSEGGSGGPVGSQSGSDPADDNLAETGGSSATPYLAGGAAALVALGGGALVLARRRRAAARSGT